MTLVILAIDALDAALIDYFDIDSFNLEESGSMKTVAHMREQPYTPEAWATAATGLHPSEHGVSKSGTSNWDNPLLSLASKFTAYLPEDTRGTLGQIVGDATGDSPAIGQTDAPTVFESPYTFVRNWPGVTDGSELQRAWDLMVEVGNTIDSDEFELKLFGLCAEQFAWAREMLNHDVDVAGVHIHTLDAAGHAYATDEDALLKVYERVAEFVDILQNELGADDEILILSDHGMTVSFYSDDDDIGPPGDHSWRAYSATTTDSRPKSIEKMGEWVEKNSAGLEYAGNSTDISIPEDQLRELGYLK